MSSIFVISTIIILLCFIPIKTVKPEIVRDIKSFIGHKKYMKLINIAVISTFINSIPNADAKVPTYDDYVNGVTIRSLDKINDRVSNIDLKQTGSDVKNTKLINKINIQNIKNLLEQITKNNAIKNWDNIISLIRQEQYLDSRYFGYGSFEKLLSTENVTKQKGTEIENFREDLNFLLKQIKDIALSNRIIFFNKVDLEQINLIRDDEQNNITNNDTANDDILSLINNANDIISNMAKILE
jgi:hypothetical protein